MVKSSHTIPQLKEESCPLNMKLEPILSPLRYVFIPFLQRFALEEMVGKGVRQVFCTDIGRDGMMSGPSVGLYRKVLSRFPQLNFIASGGVSHPGQLVELEEIGCNGAIVGKAIYENMDQLEIWLK